MMVNSISFFYMYRAEQKIGSRLLILPSFSPQIGQMLFDLVQFRKMLFPNLHRLKLILFS